MNKNALKVVSSTVYTTYLYPGSNTNTKPICNAPISPSRKLELEAREATVTGSDQRICGVKEFAFKITFKTTDTSCNTTVKRQVISDL